MGLAERGACTGERKPVIQSDSYQHPLASVETELQSLQSPGTQQQQPGKKMIFSKYCSNSRDQ